MVAKMRLRKSKTSRASSKRLATNLRFPIFDQPQIERWPLKISWEDAMRRFASAREYYMRNFDSPEKRLCDKNPQRFSLR